MKSQVHRESGSSHVDARPGYGGATRFAACARRVESVKHGVLIAVRKLKQSRAARDVSRVVFKVGDFVKHRRPVQRALLLLAALKRAAA